MGTTIFVARTIRMSEWERRIDRMGDHLVRREDTKVKDMYMNESTFDRFV